MIQEYKSLVEAARELEGIKAELSREDGTYTSPAWKIVYHAQEHITKMAVECLRIDDSRRPVCYVNSETDCDSELHTCENCGRTMCFSHSAQCSDYSGERVLTCCAECTNRS